MTEDEAKARLDAAIADYAATQGSSNGVCDWVMVFGYMEDGQDQVAVATASGQGIWVTGGLLDIGQAVQANYFERYE